MILVDKHRAKRKISLGYGYEEKERKRANRRERQGEKCLSWDMMVVAFFVVVFCHCRSYEAFSLASSVFFTGGLACKNTPSLSFRSMP
jgi:hypothetical protein